MRKRYHYLCAFYIHLSNQGQTDMCIPSAENPKAARKFHPLTLNVLERPLAVRQPADRTQTRGYRC